MTAFIQTTRQLIAGSILAAALSATGCTASNRSYLLSEKTSASHQPGVRVVDSTRAQEVAAAVASRPAENSSSAQLDTPEIQLVGASDFDGHGQNDRC